jgi:hypothetical protein
VEITYVQQSKPVESTWQPWGTNMIVPDLDTFGVPLAPPIQSAQFERGSNKRMNRVPVLNVEEIDTLAEYVCFVVCLDPQALPRVQAPQTLLQFNYDRIVSGAL